MRSVLVLASVLFAFSASAGPAGVCPDGRININAADAATLTTLKGVGKKKAAKIIADRGTNGPFANIGALSRVKGVGKKSVTKWSAKITTNCSAKALSGDLLPELNPGTKAKGGKGTKALPATTVAGRANPDAPLDLNTATAAQLATIKGIGLKTAQAIVTLRTQKKGFKSVDELTEVKGIGEGKLAKIRGRLTVK